MPFPNIVERLGPSVIRLTWEELELGQEVQVQLASDQHTDNINARLDLIRKDLEDARAREAVSLFFGDTFCAMQGKYDPRSNFDELHPEDLGQAYLDNIVKRSASVYGPYADLIKLVSLGNHETNIIKRHGTNLVSQLAHRLNTEHGGAGQVLEGAYGGWVLFRLRYKGGESATVKLRYHHGAGGGGPVTRGVIQSNRQAVYLPDADMVVNGHTHDNWVLPIARTRITAQGRIYSDLQYHIRTPAYKDEFRDGSEGWNVERWGSPKPLGCVFVKLSLENRGKSARIDPTPRLHTV